MAEPITFYQQGAAAGQQVDKYSTNPGCVDSKNLDIFSDSQAIKGMAWSQAEVPTGDNWVDIDPKERFYLATDGRVWDSQNEIWIDHSFFDTNANNIDYKDGTGSNKAIFGTPKKLYVQYSGNDWKTISILTDRLIYNIYSDWIHIQVGTMNSWWTSPCYQPGSDEPYQTYVSELILSSPSTGYNETTYHNRLAGQSWPQSENRGLDTPGSYAAQASKTESYMRCKVKLEAVGANYIDVNIRSWIANIEWDNNSESFKYKNVEGQNHYEIIGSISSGQSSESGDFYLDNIIPTSVTSNSGVKVYARTSANASCSIKTYFYKKEDWSYLQKGTDVVEIDDEIYVKITDTKYIQLRFEELTDEDDNKYYQLVQENEMDLPEGYNIVAFARGFDYSYIFVNKDDFAICYYATDVNLATWDIGWKYSGTQFINAMMIGNYVYVIAEKRGVRGLYIFSKGDMKLLVGCDKRYSEPDSLIDGKQLYNFTGPMCNWRDQIVCATKDSVFMWGRNKLGQNVGAFILTVDGEITELKTNRGKLDVLYEKNQIIYRKSILDAENIVNYESEWSVTYPVQINTHLIEKEPMKMEVSYNLPNGDTSLDVYINVNDYYFWTFESDSDVELEEGDKFKLVGCGGDYWLIFVEKIGNLLTFYLDGDLPYQVNNTKQIISEDENTTINFTALNHFKHIDTCTKDSEYYPEGKYTILNISNRNKLPVVRKMQVKVVGTNTDHNTPELYSIRLLSNQFDK